LPAPSSPPADELDRLFRRLVLNLAELDPSRTYGPVDVNELYQHLVPYRTHRSVLGIDSHEDYEMTVLRLLAGERGYAFVEPEEARTALANEAAGINPDTSLYRRYGAAKVTFDPDHVRAALGDADMPAAADERAPADLSPTVPERPAPDAWFPEPPDDAPEIETGGDAPDEGADQPELPFALDDEASPEAEPASPRTTSAPCAFCGGELPVGRAVIFCPHCGQNVGVVHCPSCGAELDVGWRFCITCGRKMAGLG
jgi:Double zinc ribbon